MRSKHFRLLFAMIMILLSVMACNFGTAIIATATPAATTEIGKDVPTTTDLLFPTETATLEPTADPTETPDLEPSETPEPGLPVARVNKELNCRVGPGGNYDLILTFKSGDVVEIMARDLGGGFVFVQNPNEPDQGCWVLENGLAISGDVTPLPAFTPPPSPTSAPNFSVKYKNLDTCEKGPARYFVRFTITNIGDLPFRSAYIKVTNLKNGESTEQSVNAFDLTTGCIIAQNISPLGPGKTGYLQSEVFRKPLGGQKMKAIFQLCTEQGLKGACVTDSLEFFAK